MGCAHGSNTSKPSNEAAAKPSPKPKTSNLNSTMPILPNFFSANRQGAQVNVDLSHVEAVSQSMPFSFKSVPKPAFTKPGTSQALSPTTSTSTQHSFDSVDEENEEEGPIDGYESEDSDSAGDICIGMVASARPTFSLAQFTVPRLLAQYLEGHVADGSSTRAPKFPDIKMNLGKRPRLQKVAELQESNQADVAPAEYQTINTERAAEAVNKSESYRPASVFDKARTLNGAANTFKPQGRRPVQPDNDRDAASSDLPGTSGLGGFGPMVKPPNPVTIFDSIEARASAEHAAATAHSLQPCPLPSSVYGLHPPFPFSGGPKHPLPEGYDYHRFLQDTRGGSEVILDAESGHWYSRMQPSGSKTAPVTDFNSPSGTSLVSQQIYQNQVSSAGSDVLSQFAKVAIASGNVLPPQPSREPAGSKNVCCKTFPSKDGRLVHPLHPVKTATPSTTNAQSQCNLTPGRYHPAVVAQSSSLVPRFDEGKQRMQDMKKDIDELCESRSKMRVMLDANLWEMQGQVTATREVVAAQVVKLKDHLNENSKALGAAQKALHEQLLKQQSQRDTRANNLQGEIEALRAAMKGQNEARKAAEDALRQEWTYERNKVNDLKPTFLAEIENLKATQKRTTACLSDVTQKFEGTKEIEAELNTQKKQRKDFRDSMQGVLRKADGKIKVVEGDISALSAKFTETEMMKQSLSQDLANLKEKLESRSSVTAKVLEQTSVELQNLRADVANVKAKVTDKSSDNSRVLQEVKTEQQKYSDQISAFTARFATLEATQQQLQALITDVLYATTERDKSEKIMRAEVDILRSDLLDAIKTITSMQLKQAAEERTEKAKRKEKDKTKDNEPEDRDWLDASGQDVPFSNIGFQYNQSYSHGHGSSSSVGGHPHKQSRVPPPSQYGLADMYAGQTGTVTYGQSGGMHLRGNSSGSGWS